MPMSSGGYAASSSGCATRPKVREIGSTGYAGPNQHSLLIGRYVMATAEHREPCDSRGSCPVLGAPGGEIPSGDSTRAALWRSAAGVGSASSTGHRRTPINPRTARILLVEAGSRVLTGFPEKLSTFARRSLDQPVIALPRADARSDLARRRSTPVTSSSSTVALR